MNGKFELHAQFILSSTVLEICTLGARDFSSAVSGFCQIFIVTSAKSLWSRALLLATDPIVSIVKSVGPDFEQDGGRAFNNYLGDFESNRCYNWLTRIDQHVKEYFQLCC